MTRKRHQKGELLDNLKHGWSCRYYVEHIGEDGLKHRKRVQKFLGSREELSLSDAHTKMDELLRCVNDPTLQPKTAPKPLTFGEAATLWVKECKERPTPVKASVIRGWEGILQNHLLPILGDTPMSEVRNSAMRSLVRGLSKTRSASTVQNVMLVVKLVVKSVVDGEGDAVYPVKWNRQFIGAPKVRAEEQPAFSTEQVTNIVKVATGRLQMVAIVLAATGLRIGELCALRVEHFNGTSVEVKKAIWNGREQEPKTASAKRKVELHPSISNLLRQYVGQRTTGYIFQTRNGSPLSTANLRKRGLDPILEAVGIPKRKHGFHAFRRFRNTYLRQNHCPVGVLKHWMGHSAKTDMSDLYDKSGANDQIPYRLDVARSMGFGFELPETPAAIGRQVEAAEIAVSVND